LDGNELAMNYFHCLLSEETQLNYTQIWENCYNFLGKHGVVGR